MHARGLIALLAVSLVILGGCDLLGGEDPAKAAAKEADGKAIGAACRHSARALEDCYVMNPKALKSAIYAGWLEMDSYMRDNKVEAVVPDLVDPPTGGKTATAADGGDKAKDATAADDEKKPAAEGKKKASAKRGAAYQAPASAQLRRST